MGVWFYAWLVLFVYSLRFLFAYLTIWEWFGCSGCSACLLRLFVSCIVWFVLLGCGLLVVLFGVDFDCCLWCVWVVVDWFYYNEMFAVIILLFLSLLNFVCFYYVFVWLPYGTCWLLCFKAELVMSTCCARFGLCTCSFAGVLGLYCILVAWVDCG